MLNTVYLSLGSNLGDRASYIQQAVEGLAKHSEINIAKVSSMYETEPVGYVDQPWFYNAALKLTTTLTPEDLLIYTKKIETELGRERIEKWGPRTIDIDILLFNGIERTKENLIIPHPRMLERAFVLVPLREIENDLSLPSGESISEFAEHLEQSEKIFLVKS